LSRPCGIEQCRFRSRKRSEIFRFECIQAFEV
jgi:hypothetical protein